MVKKRVHEIAKELKIESKEIINKLNDEGISVKSHMSTLEDREVERLLHLYGKEQAKPERKPGAAASQRNKPEQKKNMPASDGKKPAKTDGRQGNAKKPHRIAEQDYLRGPGLVDRVPSRPPDKRFEEKPEQKESPIFAGNNEPYRDRKETLGRTGAANKDYHSNAGKPQRNRPHGARNDVWRPERPGQAPGANRPGNQSGENQYGYRQPKPAGNRPPQQNRPVQDRDTQQRYGNRPGQDRDSQQRYGNRPGQDRDSQQRYGNRPGQDRDSQQRYGNRPGPGRYNDNRPAAGPRPGGAAAPGGTGQRWNDRQNRPGGYQQPNRPRPGDRPPQTTGTGGQGGRPRPDSATAAKPQGRFENKDRSTGDKSRFQDKSKSSPGKQPGRNRFDKHTSTLSDRGDKSRTRNMPGGGRRKPAYKQKDMKPSGPAQPLEKKPVVIGESVTVQELALKLYRTPAELIKKLMALGVMATINQEIDSDTASLLAVEYGYDVEIKLPVDLEAMLMQEPEEEAGALALRPCIVTVMGHVDHGKTSLLDAIRQTNVIATEAGGITQHIGAYQVEHTGKKITFVDTPGHEAFTAMRARGAQVTDIAILVVAAEDGVMPQTIEAINHAQEADVPIIVAINKIDKPDANPDRVKQELTEHGMIPEEWGGETICVNVSAVNRTGLTDLLEMILLVAEMRELKANPDRPARGTVIEAELDKGRGPVASVLVQNGTLNVGDNIIAGSASGRVRAMVDDKGRRVKKAGPSTPVEVLGFSETPMAGDVFVVVQDEKLAKNIVTRRQIRKREEDLKNTSRVSLEDLFKRIQEGQIKELGIIVKADVQGSVEALRQNLERLNTGEVKVNIVHGGVGAITETDIMLASASDAIIIGFNVRPDVKARKAAENEKVDVRLYRVIYEAIEDVKAAMSGLLDPEYKEVSLGRAEVRKIFRASKIGTIAGCYVLEGKIERGAGVRLVRDGIVIHEGKLDSLKRFKEDAKEVLQGYECGLAFEKFNEMLEGDVVEAFVIEAVKRELA